MAQTARSGSFAETQFASAATSAAVVAANGKRVKLTIANHSTTLTLYIRLGATAAVVGQGVPIAPGQLYEEPTGWKGAVQGIWTGDDAAVATVIEHLP